MPLIQCQNMNKMGPTSCGFSHSSHDKESRSISDHGADWPISSTLLFDEFVLSYRLTKANKANNARLALMENYGQPEPLF